VGGTTGEVAIEEDISLWFCCGMGTSWSMGTAGVILMSVSLVLWMAGVEMPLVVVGIGLSMLVSSTVLWLELDPSDIASSDYSW